MYALGGSRKDFSDVSRWLTRLPRPTSLIAAALLTAGLATAAQPVAASGGFTPGAKLRCTFSLRAPAPGATFDRRFQEVRLSGSCNRPVEQIPEVFLDGSALDVEGQGVVNKFRFGGASALVNVAAGRHTLEVVVHPRDASVRPFVSTWTVTAR
jgi:hypothetical protein